MRLEGNYIRTSSLGATASCGGATKDRFKWVNGKCIDQQTGKAYSGDQKFSNCQCLYGPAPSRTGQVFDFLKGAFLGGGTPGGQQLPQPGITTSSLVVPAVAVVGGVALLLILKKKK
jgi:hypothetical protein